MHDYQKLNGFMALGHEFLSLSWFFWSVTKLSELWRFTVQSILYNSEQWNYLLSGSFMISVDNSGLNSLDRSLNFTLFGIICIYLSR